MKARSRYLHDPASHAGALRLGYASHVYRAQGATVNRAGDLEPSDTVLVHDR